MYVRKTRDEFEIQQYTGRQYGWECVCAEETRKAAIEQRNCYRENQPEYPVRISKVRVPVKVCQRCGRNENQCTFTHQWHTDKLCLLCQNTLNRS